MTGAVDGGDETERVARVAARIARRAGGSLRLVMAVDVPFSHGPEFTSTLGYGSLKEEVREAAEKTLERAVTAAGAGVEIDTRIGGAPVADGIARESEDSDLLVIGSRGYGPLRRVVLGSSTAQDPRGRDVPGPRRAAPHGRGARRRGRAVRRRGVAAGSGGRRLTERRVSLVIVGAGPNLGAAAIGGRIAPGADHDPDDVAEVLWRHRTERTGFQVRLGIDGP